MKCKKKCDAIIWTIVTVSKSFRKYLSNILGKHRIKEIQKTSILGTENIFLKALMANYKIFNNGNSVMCTTNSNYRIAATLCSLKTFFQV
jgi:hypothetical protein